MPFGEEHSNTVVVKVDGSPLPPDVRGLLVSADVDDSVHVPSLAVLRFSDERQEVLDKIGATVGATLQVSVQQSGQGAPVELIDADITALELELDERGTFAVVRGLDVRHRLQSGAAVAAYAAMTTTEIVRTVLAAAGLSAQGVGSFAQNHDHLGRAGESSWELLCRLARAAGAAIWVEGRTVRFDTPPTADAAPSGRNAATDPLVVSRGDNLISLRATITGTGQVPEVEARGWDPGTKKELVATGTTASRSAVLEVTPKKLAGQVNGSRHVVRAGGATQASTTATAESVAAARAGGFAEVEGTVRGNPRLRAATAIHLVEVGPRFSGKYVLTAARHEFGPETGYLTSFTAADISDRSVLGVIAGAPTTGAAAADITRQVTTAVVTNVRDPDKLGRVRLKLPALAADYESWWARPVQLGAGRDRGVSWLPEVGDEVLVAFGQGFDEPYVLGGLYNGQDKAGRGWTAHVNGNDGKVERRALTSRNGMVVEFCEDGQTDTLTVSTNDGAQHLTLTQTGQKGIVLVSGGALKVSAEQDVTVTGGKNIAVSTDTGNLSLKAVNVTIEARAKLELKAAQLIGQGQGSAELTATAVKISGNATAELAGNGVTTIRGGLVKIN